MPTLGDLPMGDLKPADYNPRRISPTAFGILQDSIRALGVVKPIILNADGTIVAGHQRTKAMTADWLDVDAGRRARRQAREPT